MSNLELFLPIAILILSFLLKLAIDQTIDGTALITSLYELPVDIIFLALSFLAGDAIATKGTKDDELSYCICITIIAIINVIVWRKALKLFFKGYFFWSVVCTAINYFGTIIILYKVIGDFLIEQHV